MGEKVYEFLHKLDLDLFNMKGRVWTKAPPDFSREEYYRQHEILKNAWVHDDEAATVKKLAELDFVNAAEVTHFDGVTVLLYPRWP